MLKRLDYGATLSFCMFCDERHSAGNGWVRESTAFDELPIDDNGWVSESPACDEHHIADNGWVRESPVYILYAYSNRTNRDYARIMSLMSTFNVFVLKDQFGEIK